MPILMTKPVRPNRFSSLLLFCLVVGCLVLSSPAKAADLYLDNLLQIGVTPDLHANITAGQGVIVGILDSRTRSTHVEFSGKTVTFLGASSGSYSTYGDHGTHVAGIAAAGRSNGGMTGVAPAASILNIGMFDDSGWVGISDYAALQASRDFGASVVNMSYGPIFRGMLAYNDDVAAWAAFPDIVIVKAAGNDGTKLGSVFFDGDTEGSFGHVLIVGSVGATNQISSFSNRPGESCFYSQTFRNRAVCTEASKLKYAFIVAPGEGIIAPIAGSDTQYGSGSGTSMAAPHVTGAAALVKSLWPHLTAEDVVSVLKLTAQDIGETGVDGTYGWGLLDVNCALTCPLGDLTIVIEQPTDSGGGKGNGGGRKNRSLSFFRIGGLQSSGRISLSGVGDALNGFTTFDSFGRDFDGSHLADAFRAEENSFSFLREFFGYVKSSAASVNILTFNPKTKSFDNKGATMPSGTRRAIWVASVSTYGAPDIFAEDSAQLTLFEANKRHIVSSVLQSGSYQGFFTELGSNTRLVGRVSLMEQDDHAFYRQGFATDLELQFKTSESVALSFGISFTKEVGSVLGSAGSGAFDLSDEASTIGFEQHLSVKLSQRWFMDIAALTTVTYVNSDAGRLSLFSNVGTIWSFGGSVQLTGYGVVTRDDAVTFAVGLPLQSVSGHAVISGGLFDRSSRELRFEDRLVSLRTQDVWYMSVVHAVALGERGLKLGYGGYVQFEGEQYSEFGVGISLSLGL